MTSTLLVAAGASQSTTIGNILFVSISFLLLIFCVKKFAWGNITKIFDERANKIANDLDSAEEARVRASELQRQRETELKNARQDSIKIINDAKDTASKNSQQILSSAKEEAQMIQKRAQQQIDLEKQQAYACVKSDIASMSLQIAQQILEKELDEQTHQALIHSCIEGLEEYNETR